MTDLILSAKSLRKPMGKRLRFEVLKRDLFKCRYCGKSAEGGALLQVDHVIPVAKGGKNDLMNLVAACTDCNAGKSAIPLSDTNVAIQARKQAEILQLQKEQLEMMAEWRAGLKDIEEEKVIQLFSYWNELTPGFALNESFRPEIRRMLKQASFEDITSSMDDASSQYLKFDSNGNCTRESCEHAISMIARILKWKKEYAKDPGLQELVKIGGILRKRTNGSFRMGEIIDLLKLARSEGVDVLRMKQVANTVSSAWRFTKDIEELISAANEERNSIVEGNSDDDDFLSGCFQSFTQASVTGRQAELAEEVLQHIDIPGIKKKMFWMCDVCCELFGKVDSAIVAREMGDDGKWRLLVVHGNHSDGCWTKVASAEPLMPFASYIGPDNAMVYASLLEDGDYNHGAVAELMKRCQVPGYELVRHHQFRSVQAGVTSYYLAERCLFDWQIDRILAWMGAKGPHLAPPEGAPESREAARSEEKCSKE